MTKSKLCKYCRKELKKDYGFNSFCSSWCKEQYKLDKNKKVKVVKIKTQRKCKCGNELKKYKQLCDDCSLKPYEYIISNNPCKNCGGKISLRPHNKYIKLFCEMKCTKEYYYKNKKNKLTQ